jgi:PAS domain S-box-containing protein
MKNKRNSLVFGYVLAVASTALATWLHFLAKPYLGESVPYITFFPAVFVTAIFARFTPTLLAVLLSDLAAALWVIPPTNSLLPNTGTAAVGMAFFTFFGVAVALLAEQMHRKSDQLEQERERFSVTLSSIGDGVIVVDELSRVTFLNAVAEQLTGWSRDVAEGAPLESIFKVANEQTCQITENPVDKLMREETPSVDVKHNLLIRKDGSTLAINDSAAPIRHSNGEKVGVVLVFRDVTQQRESQLAAGRLAALVESSEDAILGQTFEGVITDWNSGAERLFGFAADEVIGESIFTKIVPQNRKQELLQTLQRVRQGEGGQQFDTVRQHRDGHDIPVSVWISPIYDPQGTVIGASAIDRDITQQQEIEKRRNARLSVTQILAQATNVETAIHESLAAICSALKWDIGCFWRRASDDDVLRCQAFWSVPTRQTVEFREATTNLALTRGQSLPGRVLQSRTPEWVSNVSDDPQFVRAAQAKASGLHGGFACPVSIGDDVLGVIEFFSHQIREPDDDLLEMMTTIGGQFGQFIDRCEAEQKLRRNERELNDFFENAAVGLHWVGPDGKIVRVNQAELDLLGYTRDEYLGHHIAEFHADQPVIKDILRCLTAGEQLRDYEARLRCKDGSIKTVLIDSNVRWDDDQFIHTRCITRDISDRKRIEVSLYESEERLRLAVEAGRMGTWEWGITSGEVIWSPTLEKVHGLPPGSFPGTFEAYQQDIHPEDRNHVLETIRQTVEEGREHHLEYRIIWPDGSVHWLESRGKLLKNDAGQPVRVIGVCSDISERKSLEQRLQQQLEELAEAESRTRSVVDNVIDGIITFDDKGIVASINRAAEHIFGYSASEIIGQDLRLLIPHSDQSDDIDSFPAYLKNDEQKIVELGREVTGKRKNGSTFPLDLAVSEFQFGQQRFFTGIIRDVTERKRWEQSLRFLADASKSLSSLVDYKTTLQNVAQLAVPNFADWCTVDMLDAQGSLQRLAVAHINPEKVQLAEHLYDRYPPPPDAPRGIMAVLRTGKADWAATLCDEDLVKAAHDDQHLKMLRELNLKSYICVPLRGTTQMFGVLTFVSAESGRCYDTDDVAMAEDLANRAAIAIENARLYNKVQEADRRKDEFLAMLAHELRNPLVPIRSGLDILGMEAGHHQAIIALMQEQVEHIVRLVDDLLDVSRIMRNKVELRKELVQLSTVINRSVGAVKPLVDNHRHKLTVSLPDEPVWLFADSVRLVQVVENLLTNASKYMNEGGQIDLTVARQNGRVIIDVQDTGIGIEPDLLPNVFELFTQSSRSLDRSQGGLGIGLTLVQRLVHLHGGVVSVSSDGPGHGSKFSVELPVAEPPPATEAVANVSTAIQPRRILVVDDNRGAALLLSRLLAMLGDHQVQTANDGPSGLQKILEIHPEIVLLDIGLPGMDGYQVGKKVRENPLFDDVLLVALTGYGKEEDRQKSKEAGFDEHLVKPPSIDQMKIILGHPKLTIERQE